VEYPQHPWRLQGHAVSSLHMLDVSRVRAFVPPKLSIAPVLPGKTMGGIYLAAYSVGSVLEYHELIVVCALVRYRRRLGAWISHIYVDNPRSVAGGREIWGLPKQLAEFTWDRPSGSAAVWQGQNLLCTLKPERQLPLGRLPAFLPAFSRQAENLVWFKGTGTSRLALSRGAFVVPPSSPFSVLGFGGGLGLGLHALRLLVHGPRHLSPR
jgi:acetoacetate decarboxylase